MELQDSVFLFNFLNLFNSPKDRAAAVRAEVGEPISPEALILDDGVGIVTTYSEQYSKMLPTSFEEKGCRYRQPKLAEYSARSK